MFKEIESHLDKIKVNLTIQKNGTELTVSVIPTIIGGEEAVNKAIPPFIVRGTAAELDEKFGETFEKAAEFIKGKITDLEQWKKQADEATKKSEAGKKLKNQKEKEKKEREEKAKKDIQKGDDQFKEKKYDAAKLYYRQALATLGGKDSKLEIKIAECDKLTGNIGLFGETETKEPAVTNENSNDTESSKEYDEEPMGETTEDGNDDWD